jgi:hypothetical protein
MALIPRFSTGLRNGLLDASFDMNTGFDNGFLDIYSTPKPALADDAESGSLLASIVLPATAFAAAASGGSLVKAGVWQETSANLSGTANWFRLYTSGHVTGASTTEKRIDGTVGTSGTDLILTSTSITITDAVIVDTFTVSITA